MILTKCKVCRTPFAKLSIAHKCCSPVCALTFNRVTREAKTLKANREMRVKARTRSEWIKLAQAAFNKFIRTRDEKLPCISCGRHHNGQYHAGHYLTTGAHPELRFNEDNCHKQCAPCNNHLSGNLVRYRPALIKKIGQEAVDKLEGTHEPKKWTIPELESIRTEYVRKSRVLNSAPHRTKGEI